MRELKECWHQEKIVTSDVDPANFLVQEISLTKKRIRIVDNIGSPVLIPLAFYFDYFAERRMKRYWRRFVERLVRQYPEIFTDKVARQLL